MDSNKTSHAMDGTMKWYNCFLFFFFSGQFSNSLKKNTHTLWLSTFTARFYVLMYLPE